MMTCKATSLTAATAAALTLGLGAAHDADAALQLTFNESGGDVILTTSGTLDLVGLTEAIIGPSFGASTFLDTVNEQLQLGSGVSNQPVNRYTLTVIDGAVFNSSVNLIGTTDSWTANTNSIRLQQNNGMVLVDDEIDSGDILSITATHTFAGVSLADFGLTAGESKVWLQNDNATGTDGQVIVTAVPEPSSLALLGLGGLLVARRRRG